MKLKHEVQTRDLPQMELLLLEQATKVYHFYPLLKFLNMKSTELSAPPLPGLLLFPHRVEDCSWGHLHTTFTIIPIIAIIIIPIRIMSMMTPWRLTSPSSSSSSLSSPPGRRPKLTSCRPFKIIHSRLLSRGSHCPQSDCDSHCLHSYCWWEKPQ